MERRFLELIKEEDSELIANVDKLKYAINSIDIDNDNITKLKKIVGYVCECAPEIYNDMESIIYREEVHNIELQNLLFQLNQIDTNDKNLLQSILISALKIIEEPERIDIFNTSLVDAVQEPIPQGLIFPYGGPDNKIKLRAGVPTIIGAYTGIGKSSVMLNLAYHYYKNDPKIKQWIYSLEMSASDMAVNLIQLYLEDNKKYTNEKIDYYTIKTNNEQYLNQLKSFQNRITVFTNDKKTVRINISEIETKIHYSFAMGTLPDIIYIDYLQIVSSEGFDGPYDARREMIDTMGRLTQLAKKYKFYLVILAQANRAGVLVDTIKIGSYLKAPDMNTLQESSFIEQASGLVVMLGRIYIKDSKEDALELKVEKNRFGASRISNFYTIIKESKKIEQLKEIEEEDLKKK